MREFLIEVLAVVTPGAIAVTVMFGVMIGALYGFSVLGDRRPHYPVDLWAVGIAFIVVLTALALAGETQLRLEPSVGRAVLWTFFCAAIPIGRFGRRVLTLAVLRRKRRRLE